jgi:Transposase, Mutator family
VSCNQLRVLCERRLEDLNLVVLMIDGIHFGGQVLVVALGIAESGAKHVLGVWQGATENTTVVKGLLEDLVDRGLNRQRRYLVVMDGSKALRAGVERVFGEQVEVQRCQLHKRIVSVHGAAGGSQRKALARRRSAAALDRHRTLGSREKVPTHQRISRNLVAEGTLESVAPSAEGGPDSRSCLNLVAGRLIVPNIESRCNQLKLGHPHSVVYAI